MTRWLKILAVCGLAFGVGLFVTPASADVGPKPRMTFTIAYHIAPVALTHGELFECAEPTCASARPLPRLGPQGFGCSAEQCSATAYGFQPYHKLVLTFADRKRESDVFAAQSGEFRITVLEDRLHVERTYPFQFDSQLAGLVLALPVTLTIELLVCLLYCAITKIHSRVVLSALLANVLSLPIVWLVLPLISGAPWMSYGVAEIFAVLFEAAILYRLNGKQIGGRHALVLSVAMNAASFLIGLGLALIFPTFSNLG